MSTLQGYQVSSSHTPRSNQHDRTVLNNAQLNVLVDKVFARVLDLAHTRRINFNSLNNQYELETLDLERIENSRSLNTPRLDRFLPDDPLTDIKFMVFNHTCPICLASFENAQFLVRHFNNQHVLAKPTYRCSVCTDEIKYMSIDDYFRHCFCDDEHLNWFLGTFF